MTLPLADAPPCTSLGIPLDTSPESFGELRRSDDLAGDVPALRKRLAEDGYLLMPGLLPRADVEAARAPIVAHLATEGHLASGTLPEHAVARPGANVYFRPDLARENRPLQRLLYRPEGAMMRFWADLLGGPVRHFDYTWLRCVAPGKGTPPHCDIVYMGRGTKNLFTAWTPLCDIDLAMGGVMILEGSHRNERLRAGYGSRDVDSYCENDPNDPARSANGGNGWLSDDPARLRRGIGGRWLTAEYRAGDVLLFNMYLAHGAIDNRSDRFRISADSRYQLASDPVDERWVGANPPAHGAAGKRGRVC